MQKYAKGQRWTRPGTGLIAIVSKVDTWYNDLMYETRTRVWYNVLDKYGSQQERVWQDAEDFEFLYPKRTRS